MRKPPDRTGRDRWIDLIRVVAVAVVVVGHWLTTTVIWETDRVGIENALSVIRESHPVTWLIQVMPLMFFAGGFSNYRSLDLHEGNGLAFLRTRYRRLLSPTLVFIAVWTAIGIAGSIADLTLPHPLDRAADLAALPFWFLGLYLFVVALAPAMVVLHRRFSWRVVGVMALGAALVDIAHYPLGVPHIGALNFAFVWLLAHQLGFFYADGSLLRVRRRYIAAATAIGLGGLIVLTTVADYPVSMVGVPGDERWNTNPPSLALVMLTIWLVGLALLLRPLVNSDTPKRHRWLEIVHSRILTVFLWHVSALAVAAAFLYGVGLSRPDTGTGAWWAQRPIWLVASAGALWAIVGVFARFEVHPKPASLSGYADAGLAALGVVAVGFGILGLGETGFNRFAEPLGEGLLGFSLNPLTNLAHLLLGLVALRAAFGAGRKTAGAAGALVAVSFVAMGLVGLGGSATFLGTNEATASLQLGVGVVGSVLAWRAWRGKR